ncbi:MAG: RNA-binding cell elongation regulator Jag/EloR [Lachnospiraceae bacterium]
MAEFINVTGKTVEEAVKNALVQLDITEDCLIYEIVDKGSTGFLGFGAKQAVIKAKKKNTVMEDGVEFLERVFKTMNMQVTITMSYDEEEKTISYDLEGDDMGVLIGKRGQTLDSLQHLVSLVVNKNSENYLRVKLDTENYRERRKETLENLAKNIAFKVKKTRKPVALEPMNPYERRIIHSALQNDQYVTTKSEGEEPFRHVIVMMKKEYMEKPRYNSGERKYVSKDGSGERKYTGKKPYNSNGYRNTTTRDYTSGERRPYRPKSNGSRYNSEKRSYAATSVPAQSDSEE